MVYNIQRQAQPRRWGAANISLPERERVKLMSNIPTKVSKDDSLSILVTGVKPGEASRSGVPTTIVNKSYLLQSFLDEHGPGGKPAEMDMEALQALASTDPTKFQQEMAALSQKMLDTGKAGGGSLPDMISQAICNYLSGVHKIIISEKDPGDNVWYVNPADLTLNVQKHGADGFQWFCTLAAPFG